MEEKEIKQQLKILRRITPDAEFSRRSRETILGLPAIAPLRPWKIFTTSIQFGSAIALTAVLLLVILGGISAWKYLSPFRLSSLDPASLKAEAEAVDIQIELSTLSYTEAAKQPAAPPTAPTLPPAEEKTAPAEEIPATKVSIDRALEILTQ